MNWSFFYVWVSLNSRHLSKLFCGDWAELLISSLPKNGSLKYLLPVRKVIWVFQSCQLMQKTCPVLPQVLHLEIYLRSTCLLLGGGGYFWQVSFFGMKRLSLSDEALMSELIFISQRAHFSARLRTMPNSLIAWGGIQIILGGKF